MKKEFKTLSDERIGQLYNNEVGVFYYPEEKVKEFIKIIFEDCCIEANFDDELRLSQIKKILNKRAGGDLI